MSWRPSALKVSGGGCSGVRSRRIQGGCSLGKPWLRPRFVPPEGLGAPQVSKERDRDKREPALYWRIVLAHCIGALARVLRIILLEDALPIPMCFIGRKTLRFVLLLFQAGEKVLTPALHCSNDCCIAAIVVARCLYVCPTRNAEQSWNFSWHPQQRWRRYRGTIGSVRRL